MDLQSIYKRLTKFAQDRDWEQFHSPKNLSMALGVEVSELMEHFQWMSEEQSRAVAQQSDKKAQVAEEIVDVILYSLRLCQQLDIDLEEAIDLKMEKNAKKYPAELVRGSSKKYDQY